jgi:hypothetical protein
MKLLKIFVFIFLISLGYLLKTTDVNAEICADWDEARQYCEESPAVPLDFCGGTPPSGTFCAKGTVCPLCNDDCCFSSSGCCSGATDWTKYELKCIEVQFQDLFGYMWIEKEQVCSIGDKCLPGATNLNAGKCNCSTGGVYKYCCDAFGSPIGCSPYGSGPQDDGIYPPEGECPGGWEVNGTTVRDSPCTPIVPPTVIDGECSETTYQACDEGDVASANGDGTWFCLGIDGGSNATCIWQKFYKCLSDNCVQTSSYYNPTPSVQTSYGTTIYRYITDCNNNGSCGVSSGSCTSGTLSWIDSVGSDGFYNWNCVGSCDGSTASCSSAAAPTPVDGVCGSSTGTCNPGNLSWIDSVGSDGFYNWNCVGTNGGSTASCSSAAAPTPVDGVCGSSTGTCNVGNLSWIDSVGSDGFYNWNCVGTNGGSTASCSSAAAPTPVDGVCGSSTGTCNVGNLSWIDIVGSDGTYNWNCVGTNGGSTASCSSASCTPVSGSCGVSSGSCNNGNLSWIDSVGSDGFYNWNCVGSCGGSTASCSSASCTPSNGVDGICGSSDGQVFASTPSTNLCSSGTASSVILSGSTYSWTCLGAIGTCGGSDGTDDSCSATANSAPTFSSFDIRNINNTSATAESGRNHICQSIFTGTGSPDTARFVVVYSDAQTGSDIDYIQLRIGSETFTDNTLSVSGNLATAVFDLSTAFVTSRQLESVHTLAADINGSITSFADTSRDFKYWDCLVSASGTAYNGTDTGAICSDSDSFINPIDSSLGYDLLMNDVGPGSGDDKSMTVTSPTYSSGSNSLIWGRDYLFDLSNFAGSDPSQIRLNGSSCSNIQFTIDNSVIDPYSSSTSFVADFSSIIDQDPWWQVSDGGVISNNTVNNRVPVTCLTNCKISLNGLVSAVNINNTGKSLSEAQSWYYSGSSARLANVNTNYSYFYNQYFVKNGIGTVLTGNKTIADISGTGIYFVSGDLTIDNNKIINSGEFLMIIVNGNINVSETVDRIDGIFVANDINATGNGSNQLVFNGSLFAFNNINFSRSYSNVSLNNANPAIVVNHNPQLLFNLPGSVTKVLTNWQWGN